MMGILRAPALAAIGILILLGVGLTTGAARAASPFLEEAKRACEIGEGVDGYFHIKTETPSDQLAREVRNVNLLRKARYGELAREAGEPLQVVAALTAEELIAKLPEGACYLDSQGVWRVKEAA